VYVSREEKVNSLTQVLYAAAYAPGGIEAEAIGEGRERKLSAALRRGALLHAQTYEVYYREGLVCALGAIYAGSGRDPRRLIDPSYEETKDLHFLWPQLGDSVVVPGGEGEEDTLYDAITYLNDMLGYTFNDIAAWLESEGY
jgi:hypothetical protein